MSVKSFYGKVDFSSFARGAGVVVNPTSLCVSPWTTKLQYGGNTACALYTGLKNQLPLSATTEVPFRCCHFSLFFFKPVPQIPLLLVPLPPLRIGKKAVHLQSALVPICSETGQPAGDEVARSIGVFQRVEDISHHGATANPQTRKVQHNLKDDEDDLVSIAEFKAEGDGGQVKVPRIGNSPVPHWEKKNNGFMWSLDCKVPKYMMKNDPRSGKTVQFWSRLRIPIFENEKNIIDPMHRILLFGEGTGGVTGFLPLRRYSYVNSQFSCSILREPTSEWVSLRGRSECDPLTGSGLATSTMFDEEGLCAVISQPQIVEDQTTLNIKR